MKQSSLDALAMTGIELEELQDVAAAGIHAWPAPFLTKAFCMSTTTKAVRWGAMWEKACNWPRRATTRACNSGEGT